MKKHLILALLLLLTLQLWAQNSPYLQKTGKVDSLYSKVLKENRVLYIQLPQDYNPKSDQKYPVVYLLDGEVWFPTLANVQQFYSGGFMPEMILVGISNQQNRTRDLTPTKIKTKYGMPFREESGGAKEFTKFVAQELIPYIEKHYPATSYRTLIGHSYGGLWVINTLLHEPDLFENYLAIDPSLDWDDQYELKEARKILAKRDFKGKGLYISLSGQLHMQNPDITIDNVMEDTSSFTLFARSNIGFSQLAKQYAGKNGLEYSWQFYPDELHGTIAVPSIREGLITLFKWFQMENTYRFNDFDTPQETLSNFVKYRENKLFHHFGYHVPPYPEDLLNMLGYMNMDMQQLDKAKMFFDFAIQYYPKSANAYDSMGDYYEHQHEKEKALECLTKAYQLSGDDRYKKRMEKLEKEK